MPLLIRIVFVFISIMSTSIEASQTSVIKGVEKRPVIDGLLDKHLATLPVRHFERFYDFDNDGPVPATVSYRIAHHADGLYLYFETDADAITYRKRGFIYGDGFKVVVGKYNPYGRAKEYVEMVYSPTKREEDMPSRQYISSYNVTGKPRRLSDKSEMQEALFDGGTGFEVFLSWQDINPYHFHFTQNIGLNLYFAKGILDKAGTIATYGYAIRHDEGIWDEAVDHRVLAPFSFSQPTGESQPFSMTIVQRTLPVGQALNLKTYGGSHTDSAETWHIRDKENVVVASGKLNQKGKAGHYQINVSGLVAGTYVFELLGHSQSFSLLPDVDLNNVLSTLWDMEDVSRGTKNTLLFRIEQIQKSLDSIKPYESKHELVEQMVSLEDNLKLIEQGNDPFVSLKSPYRRAFRSKLDGTLQPYTIKLPDNYEPSKKYPLLVFMHGSGQDEQRLLDQPRSNGEFIEIAPYARDKFYAYAFQQSDIDINEAIADAITNFSVDEKRIIVGGFSMGGYGALLTYIRNPERYAGVAVFAGHPNLANQWLDTDIYADFTKPEALSSFHNTPVFIYHGTADPALDVTLMQKLAADLEYNGALVTTSFVDGQGHVYQDSDTHKRYLAWLESLVTQ